MLLPFHVSCSEPSVPLFRLADGRFQLTKDGPLAPFMDGHGYFLIQPDLVQFLEELGVPAVRFEPAIVWHRSSDQEFTGYVNLLVEQFLDSSMLSELDLSGYKLVSYNNRYLFTSAALKSRLESNPFEYLHFSEGFSKFAADKFLN